jgi:hypothetical protein
VIVTGVNRLKERAEKHSLLIFEFVLNIHLSSAAGVGRFGRYRERAFGNRSFSFNLQNCGKIKEYNVYENLFFPLL